MTKRFAIVAAYRSVVVVEFENFFRAEYESVRRALVLALGDAGLARRDDLAGTRAATEDKLTHCACRAYVVRSLARWLWLIAGDRRRRNRVATVTRLPKSRTDGRPLL